ncbi:MAG: hypothetical protein WB245_00120, partial [Acidimicrobiia bacterium]
MVSTPASRSIASPEFSNTPELVSRLKKILSNHPGSSQVLLNMTSDQGVKVLKLSDDHRVEPRTALFAELKELLGPSAIL